MNNTGTNLLWYKEKARSWNEALAIGNGRIGGMVFGGAVSERISLNEDTLWSGKPWFHENPGAAEAFQRARELALKREYPEAQEIWEKNGTAMNPQAYLSLGDLELTMRHPEAIGEYRRWLALDEAMKITADKPGSVSFDVHLAPAMNARVEGKQDRQAIVGNCPLYEWRYEYIVHPYNEIFDLAEVYGDTDEMKGVGYRAEMIVVPEGGKILRTGGNVTVKGADGAVVSRLVAVLEAPKKLAFGASSLCLGKGDSFPLTVRVPDGAAAARFTYASSKKSVVSVDASGTLKANKTGKAKITATAYNGARATVTVKVVKAPSKVKLSAGKLVLCLDETRQLKAALPSGIISRVEWASSDDGVVSVDDTGLLRAVAAGKATITVTTKNKKKASITITVK